MTFKYLLYCNKGILNSTTSVYVFSLCAMCMLRGSLRFLFFRARYKFHKKLPWIFQCFSTNNVSCDLKMTFLWSCSPKKCYMRFTVRKDLLDKICKFWDFLISLKSETEDFLEVVLKPGCTFYKYVKGEIVNFWGFILS